MNLKVAYLILSLIFIGTLAHAQDDLDIVRNNILSYYEQQTLDSLQTMSWLNEINDHGMWPDIDYANVQTGNWPVLEHAKRVLNLSIAWRVNIYDGFRNDAVKSKILDAYNHWVDFDYQNPNWWYKAIGVPQNIGPATILLRDVLSKQEREKGLVVIRPSKLGMTGQNKIWLAGNVIYRSVLTRDTALLSKAVQAISEEMTIRGGEGIQADYSFHQHGPQQQFGNYGLSFASEIARFSFFLKDSRFKINPLLLANYKNYLWDGLRWVSFKGFFDISACGRQLFPDSPKKKGQELNRILEQYSVIDTTVSPAIYPVGNKHFWRSDYTIHRTAHFFSSIKMSSERVIGSESGNGENLLGYHLGDGVMYVSRSGEEYNNIFPFWDWSKLPGTTTYLDTAQLPVLTWKGYRNQAAFVGGVSNGINGLSSMLYLRNGLDAYKSWFQFDDAVVCIGSGISADIKLPITTTINQCLLKGEVIAADNEYIRSIGNGQHFFENLQWLVHDSIGYYFFYNQQVVVENNKHTGSWNKVANYLSDDMLEEDIFTLSVEHGEEPENGSYAYAIIPNVDRSKMESYYRYQLLKNTEKIHAVRDVETGMYGISFFKGGGLMLSNDLGIGVNKPALMLLKPFVSGLDISIAEPTCLLDSLTLTLVGQYEAEPGVKCSVDTVGHETSIVVMLPDSLMRGSTINLSLVHKD